METAIASEIVSSGAGCLPLEGCLRRSNLNINDVLGDFSLTLVDALDMLAVVGNASEFRRAARLVIDNLSFHKNSTVQVFESNIRYVLHI